MGRLRAAVDDPRSVPNGPMPLAIGHCLEYPIYHSPLPFIRTLLERWAYAYAYEHEAERLAALPPALDFYNRFRPHRALGGLTPLQRVNNLPGTYS